MSKGDNLYKSPGVITEIVFGARCKKKMIDEVLAACKEKHIRFRRAVLKSKSFSMVIIDDPSLNQV